MDLPSAGFIIGAFGIQAALFIDAITFAISGAIIIFIKIEETLNKQDKLNFSKFIIEYKEGFAYLKTQKIVFFICLYAVTINFFSVPVNTYLAMYIGDSLKLNADIFSIVNAIMMVGIIVGERIIAQDIRENRFTENFYTVRSDKLCKFYGTKLYSIYWCKWA